MKHVISMALALAMYGSVAGAEVALTNAVSTPIVTSTKTNRSDLDKILNSDSSPLVSAPKNFNEVINKQLVTLVTITYSNKEPNVVLHQGVFVAPGHILGDLKSVKQLRGAKGEARGTLHALYVGEDGKLVTERIGKISNMDANDLAMYHSTNRSSYIQPIPVRKKPLESGEDVVLIGHAFNKSYPGVITFRGSQRVSPSDIYSDLQMQFYPQGSSYGVSYGNSVPRVSSVPANVVVPENDTNKVFRVRLVDGSAIEGALGFNRSFESGYYGAPVFDQHGFLCGIAVRSSPYMGYISSIDPIKNAVRQVLK